MPSSEQDTTFHSLCLLLQHALRDIVFQEGIMNGSGKFDKLMIRIVKDDEVINIPKELLQCWREEYLATSYTSGAELQTPQQFLTAMADSGKTFVNYFMCEVEVKMTTDKCNCTPFIKHFGNLPERVEGYIEVQCPMNEHISLQEALDLSLYKIEDCLDSNCREKDNMVCQECLRARDEMHEQRIWTAPTSFFIHTRRIDQYGEVETTNIQNLDDILYLTTQPRNEQNPYRLVGGLLKAENSENVYTTILRKGQFYYEVKSDGSVQKTDNIGLCEIFLFKKLKKEDFDGVLRKPPKLDDEYVEDDSDNDDLNP